MGTVAGSYRAARSGPLWRRWIGPVVALIAALCPTMGAAAADRFERTRWELARIRADLGAVSDPLTRAGELLRSGDPDAALALVPQLDRLGEPGRGLAATILLHRGDFADARARIEALDPEGAANRQLRYEWLFATDDLARIDEETCRRLAQETAETVDHNAAGRLRQAVLDEDGAEHHFVRVLHAPTATTTGDDLVRAHRGLAAVAFRRRDFDLSLIHLELALGYDSLDAELLNDLSATLVRLGRTDAAITAAELAVELAPYHEAAHYALGNGYARKNYSQLFAAYPASFADPGGRTALAAADALLEGGDVTAARRAYEAVERLHPGWADVPVRLGSLAFAQGEYRLARDHFVRALRLCPEYGRAHNGLAKALEAERLVVEVHRARYEREFAERAMPQIPRLDALVTNWAALSPRHQKQVALSIAPLQRYLPVLIEGGLTYYIKPLYALLSETPGQNNLRDQRISYDSRLWDDVRGCGGYHTVTGIEDVERTVLGRYNTVLHELSHQVHGVLPVDAARRIQELYRQTKSRDEITGDAFLSRYAGGSVWEYFAEGINSLATPQRDAYDTREIVRERLLDKDPALAALIVELRDAHPIEPCYPVAYVGRGQQELEHARPEAAIESYHKALTYDPREPTALAALVHALQLAGRNAAALDWAQRATAWHPQDGDLAQAHAAAAWHAGRGLATALSQLTTARTQVREEDRFGVDLLLGQMHWTAGDATAAAGAYDRVLTYQADNPDGLWGRATTLALAGQFEPSWAAYEQAVRHRTGVVRLRADFARDLLLAGELAAARVQLDAATLLDPTEPRVRALEAWFALESGDPERAHAIAAATVDEHPWCAMARMVAARAAADLGLDDAAQALLAPLRARLASNAPPRYVFRPQWGRYEQVETHPAIEHRLLNGRLAVGDLNQDSHPPPTQ